MADPIPFDPDAFVKGLQGTARANSAATSTTSPGGLNFVGPTNDPRVIEARANLSEAAQNAVAKGADPYQVALAEKGGKPNWGINALTKVINFDLLPDQIPLSRYLPGRGDTNISWGKKQVTPIRSVVVPTAIAVDTGLRAVLSSLKETGDLVAGLRGNKTREVTRDAEGNITTSGKTGWNWDDFIKQTKDPTLGYGTLVKDPFGKSNIYARTGNRLLGFTGDYLLNPINWFTGAGGIATNALRSAKYVSKEAFQEAVQKEGVRSTMIVARDLLQEQAQLAVREAERVAADVTLDAATKAAARAAADDALDLAEEAAANAKKLNRDVAALGPKRVYSAANREALAQQVLQVRKGAEQTLLKPGVSAGESAWANKVIEALPDELIGRIATEGPAAVYAPALKILKGEVTPAQEVLGLTGGIRFTPPGLKFANKRAGESLYEGSKIIPGSERVSNLIGLGMSKSRVGVNFLGSPLPDFLKAPISVLGKGAQGIKNFVTPTGEGGFFGSADIYRMRTGLRTGKITGAEAVKAIQRLTADQIYRGGFNALRKKGAARVAGVIPSSVSDDLFDSVVPYIDTAPELWDAAGLKPLSKEQEVVYNNFRAYMNVLDGEANTAATRFGGPALARVENYFPRIISNKARKWVDKNPDIVQALSKNLGDGFDSSFFQGNYHARDLQEGSFWFGYKLDADDIKRGTTRLNEIARNAVNVDSAGKSFKNANPIDFDFFNMSGRNALQSYTDRHVRYLAYHNMLKAIDEGKIPALQGLSGKLTKTVEPATKSGMKINTVEKLVKDLTSSGIENWSEVDIQDVIGQLDNLALKLKAGTVFKNEVDDAVASIKQRFDEVNKMIAAGTIDPIWASLTQNEINNYASLLLNKVGAVKTEFTGSPATRWKQIVTMAEDGFRVLNEKTAPDLVVQEEIADMLTNIRKLNDPKVATAFNTLFGWVNNFSKANYVATPGFHTRNVMGGIMSMVSADVNGKVALEGWKAYKALKEGIAAGKSPVVIVKKLVADGTIRPVRAQAILDSLEISGATGFGQTGEVLEAIGGTRTGITSTGPARNRASEVLGYPTWKSRQFGANLEEGMRFAMVYDGIVSGLDMQSSAARASKFLVDYNDLSKLDRVAKQIVPFWMWMSRNIPLQAQNVWLNPKSYSAYANFQRNFEGAEMEFQPLYSKARGEFPTPFQLGEGFAGTLMFRPPFGFPGAGQPNPLQEIAEGDSPFGLLANVTAPVRLFSEYIKNEKAFSGKPIASEFDSAPSKTKALYILTQAIFPLSPVSRTLRAIPLLGRNKLIQTLSGTTVDEEHPLMQELVALLSWLGLPVTISRPAEQVGEIKRRINVINDEIKRMDKKANEGEYDFEKKVEQTDTSGSEEFNPDDFLNNLGTQP